MRTWVVRVENDDVNSTHSMVYALHRLTGLPVGDAWKRMTEINECGSADIGRFDGREDAERLAVRCLVFGLHATVGPE